MTPEMKKKFFELMKSEEGYRQFVYEDTTGHFTVGIGRNLVNRGVSLQEAKMMWENDIDYFMDKLSKALPFFDSLDEVRQIVLTDMCFNLGLNGLLNFKDMLKAVETKDFNKASQEMLDSKWAMQVKGRSLNLSKMMKSGEF